MNSEIHKRKGARKAQDIPTDVLDLLNKGEIETVNLTEWLAVEHTKLIREVFPKLGIDQDKVERISKAIESQKKSSTMQTTKQVGATLHELYSKTDGLDQIFDKLSSQTSDSIRCYAPYLIGLDQKSTIKEKLLKVQGLVADKHFGVREVVWMALRPAIDESLGESIKMLSQWTRNEDENIRRFATESTRPRGVWCKPIEELKQKPELGLPLLEPLKSDSSKYVQDSVGNWLNDASKSKPEFVITLCDRWKKESPTKETDRIIKRAKRTIDKNNRT